MHVVKINSVSILKHHKGRERMLLRNDIKACLNSSVTAQGSKTELIQELTNRRRPKKQWPNRSISTTK